MASDTKLSEMINSIKGVMGAIAGIKLANSDNKEYVDIKNLFYRGHSSDSFWMMPSVFRENSVDEHTIFTEVLRKHLHADFENMTDFEILSKMQHYQVSTRLLDLTETPLIASFFALSNLERNKVTLKNPEIICMNFADDEIKDFYSPQVTALSTLPRLTKEERRNLYFDVLNEMTISYEIIEKLKGNNGNDFNLSLFYQNNKTAIQYIQFCVLTFCKIINHRFDADNKYTLKKEDRELFKRQFEENFNIMCFDNESLNNEQMVEILLLLDDEQLKVDFNINIQIKVTTDYNFYVSGINENNNSNGNESSDGFMINVRNKKNEEKVIINLAFCLIKEEMKGGNYAHYFMLLNKELGRIFLHKNIYDKNKIFELFKLNNGMYFSESAEKLHFYITKYDSTFKRNLKPIDLLNGVVVKPVINNERVNAQHGAFALFGLSNYWNFGKSLEFLEVKNSNAEKPIVINKFIADNIGFANKNKNFMNDESILKELENYVLNIVRIRFKDSFFKNKNKVDNYLDRLSKIAGIDIKSLGCRMDSTYYQLTK